MQITSGIMQKLRTINYIFKYVYKVMTQIIQWNWLTPVSPQTTIKQTQFTRKTTFHIRGLEIKSWQLFCPSHLNDHTTK